MRIRPLQSHHVRTRASHCRGGGFTLIELLVVIAIIALLVGILLPALGRVRAEGRKIKDSTQVRNVVQAMITFANNNADSYPLPSKIDANNTTVAAGQASKDNTGNILSILIMAGSVTTEICVNPAESNTAQIKRDDGYQFTNPTAVSPAGGTPTDGSSAIWDPGFAGTPIDPETYRRTDSGVKVGHQSYAHLIPMGKRLARWSSTFSTTDAVFGDRGPGYTETGYTNGGRWTLAATGSSVPGVDSNTLLIHGGKNTWEGNIGYNDGHVSFETKPAPDGIGYRRTGAASPLTVGDNLFVDEQDEAGVTTQTDARQKSNILLRPVAKLPVNSGTLTTGTSSSSNLWAD